MRIVVPFLSLDVFDARPIRRLLLCLSPNSAYRSLWQSPMWLCCLPPDSGGGDARPWLMLDRVHHSGRGQQSECPRRSSYAKGAALLLNACCRLSGGAVLPPCAAESGERQAFVVGGCTGRSRNLEASRWPSIWLPQRKTRYKHWTQGGMTATW